MSYHFKTDEEYKEYAKTLSIKDLTQISKDINREKYPNRFLLLENEINRKKTDPEYKENDDKSIILPKYRTFWPRVLSYVVDSMVLLPIDMLNGWIERTAADDSFLFAAWYFVNTIAIYLYFILMHGCFGQTLGKMLLKIKVIDKSEQNEITYKQAFLRDCIPFFICILYLIVWNPASFDVDNVGISNGIPIISLFFAAFGLIWPLIEMVTMFSNDRRRALHDYIAGTVVVRI
ncbi:MAG: RDD family protein [Desulfobacter sp.]